MPLQFSDASYLVKLSMENVYVSVPMTVNALSILKKQLVRIFSNVKNIYTKFSSTKKEVIKRL